MSQVVNYMNDMSGFSEQYGHWGLVAIIVLIASGILYRYVAPKNWREWAGAGLVQASIIALYRRHVGGAGSDCTLADDHHVGDVYGYRPCLCSLGSQGETGNGLIPVSASRTAGEVNQSERYYSRGMRTVANRDSSARDRDGRGPAISDR